MYVESFKQLANQVQCTVMDVPTFQFSACLIGAIFEVPWSIFCSFY